jgi:Leucine-rich repeat (LRR) protein
MKMKKIFIIPIFLTLSLNLFSQTQFSDYESALRSPEQAETLILNIESAENILIDQRIESLRNLKELRILSYPGKSIRLPEELKRLPNLETVSLHGKHLEVLPKVIFELKNLTSLNIGYKHLNNSDSLVILQNLKSLVLFSEFDKTFPTSAYKLRNLTQLGVQVLSLIELPSGISSLDKLTHLTIDAQDLRNLPEDLNRLDKLSNIHFRIKNNVDVKLNANLNELKEFSWYLAPSFPEFICQYRNVERLQLVRGGIKEIPECICRLRQLRDLTVSNHPLEKIPECLRDLQSITMMDFRSTNIKTMDSKLLELPKLFNILIEDCESFDPKLYTVLKLKYGSKIIK